MRTIASWFHRIPIKVVMILYGRSIEKALGNSTIDEEEHGGVVNWVRWAGK